MDPLTNNYKLETRNYQRPWYKRPVFYIFLVVALIVSYYAYQFGRVYSTISVENGWWWREVANVFNIGGGKQETPDPNPMPQPEQNRLNVLILGIRGEDEIAIKDEGGLLTDTIMLVSIDKITKKAAMISIPRDLYLDMNTPAPNGKKINIKGKINEIYERGIENGGGLTIAKQIISRITGVYIDNAIVFDFNSFKEIVDNLGGIDVHLIKQFDEKTQWGYEFSLPAGNNHLDGGRALYYVRSRYSSSDFDRARRQQEVITAIKNKALSLGFLSNPVKITPLLSNLRGNVRTDFKIWDIKDLLVLANSFSAKSQAKNYVISTDNLVYETKTEKGEYILLPKEGNFEGIKNLFKTVLAQ